MILVMSVMLVTSALVVAAFTAANGEVHLTKTDRAEKKAYYAAEAGIEDYEYHLTQDGNYLDYCANPTPANPALNEFGSTAHRATVPTASPTAEATNEEYAIQLIPAESSKEKKCNPNNLVETMIEEKKPSTGTFRIESTGYSEGSERTIVATFKNLNFVSYVWYTKYETNDPVTYGEPPKGKPEYYNECAGFYLKRPKQTYPGSVLEPVRCTNNFFFTGESVNGPFHTEDAGGICGAPVLGRNETDRIEFHNQGGSETEKGYSSESCGKAAEPQFKGTYIPVKEVKLIEPPPGDEELVHVVESPYLFEEKTEIILEGKAMTIIEHKGAGLAGGEETKTGVPFPANGVIYVKGGCTAKYSPFGPVPRYEGNEVGEPTDTKCGNVWVHGNYEESLTIAAENDVVINGNITTPVNSEGVPTGNALLGLIANNFIRIYHPVLETYEGKGPELETAGVQLEGATHKEAIRAEPLESGLKMEVKNSGSEYEVLVTNSKYEVLEKLGPFTEASQLLVPTTKYVRYTEGAKYAEAKSEALKAFGARLFGVVKIVPKSPNLGKLLKVEVEEAGSKSRVKVRNEGNVVWEKEVEKASLLTGPSPSSPYFSFEQNGVSHAQGEKEKLRPTAGRWLDEKCNETPNYDENVTVPDPFNPTVHMCEYTDKGVFDCDAPNNEPKDMKEPTIYAAMLAVKHGVIVDNFSCGEPSQLGSGQPGKLNIYGTVAGWYTNGSSGSEYGGKMHGYGYNAFYDNRLEAEEPPHFLNPIEAAWYVQRETLVPNP